MRCRICKKEAVHKVRSFGIALCEEHLIQFCLKRVNDCIKRYKMFTKKDRILVAVSGGKDSLVAWDILAKLGFDVTALFIDLGIQENNHFEKAKRMVTSFAEKKGYNLVVFDLKREFGFTIDDVKRKETRTVCAACGLVKRYVMNRFAYENGFDVLATGHNLNDEVAVLLSNVLNWKIGYLARQGPVLPAEGKFVRKVKPLCELTERETGAYAIVQGIEYYGEDCPYSKGATTLVYKRALNMIEYNSPGTKVRFYREFLKIRDELFVDKERVDLKDCPECGYPTAYPPCAFCRLKERMVS
jgi:uncharacterized protein (TIGR00269 family)